MFPESFSMKSRIGVAAGILLGIAAITYGLNFFGIGEIKPLAACLRTGAPLFFLWLAWDDLSQLPRWMLQAILPTIIIVAIWPRLLFILVPMVLLVLFLLPKSKKKRVSRKEK